HRRSFVLRRITSSICYLLVELSSKYYTVKPAIETIQEYCTLEIVKSRLLNDELKTGNKLRISTVSNNEHEFKIICYKCLKPEHIAQDYTQNQSHIYQRSHFRGKSRPRGGNRGRSRGDYRGTNRGNAAHHAEGFSFVALNVTTDT
ncbi:hypothetical protein HHI36_003986, partial [Cryptolaemus montrouzieri]